MDWSVEGGEVLSLTLAHIVNFTASKLSVPNSWDRIHPTSHMQSGRQEGTPGVQSRQGHHHKLSGKDKPRHPDYFLTPQHNPSPTCTRPPPPHFQHSTPLSSEHRCE